MLTIVVPMAGRGSRFAEAGYVDPKPLIPVCGTPMIKLVIENLRPSVPHRFVFVAQRDHVGAYGLDRLLPSWAPGCAVVQIDAVTQGAAETVLLARDEMDLDGPLVIANSDQYIDTPADEWVLPAVNGELDGVILTMTADDPKWSFVELTQDDHVVRVVEKEVISEDATVGIYHFRTARAFVSAAERMIAADERVNGEFYVAPVYNQLIAAGARIGVHRVGEVGAGMHGLGTPADLEAFLARRPTLPGDDA